MNINWLDKLEKYIGWFALPNLAMYLLILQGFGILANFLNPEADQLLMLLPQNVLEQHEIWRLLTFLAIPLYDPTAGLGVIWNAIFLLFLFYIVNTLEASWGDFKITFYLFISILLTIAYSLYTYYPVYNFRDIELTLFLAIITLFPEQEILAFMIIPIKLKWFGFIIGGYLIYSFILAPPIYQFYLLAVYANYLLFFGPSFINNLKNKHRQWNFKQKMRK